MELGRNKWHFLSFVSTRLSASRAPSGPHTIPLAPLSDHTLFNFVTIYIGVFFVAFATISIHNFVTVLHVRSFDGHRKITDECVLQSVIKMTGTEMSQGDWCKFPSKASKLL